MMMVKAFGSQKVVHTKLLNAHKECKLEHVGGDYYHYKMVLPNATLIVRGIADPNSNES